MAKGVRAAKPAEQKDPQSDDGATVQPVPKVPEQGDGEAQGDAPKEDDATGAGQNEGYTNTPQTEEELIAEYAADPDKVQFCAKVIQAAGTSLFTSGTSDEVAQHLVANPEKLAHVMDIVGKVNGFRKANFAAEIAADPDALRAANRMRMEKQYGKDFVIARKVGTNNTKPFSRAVWNSLPVDKKNGARNGWVAVPQTVPELQGK